MHMLLIIGGAGCSQAQDLQLPRWTITVKVIDERNESVTNAHVKVWWHIPPPDGESIAMTNVAGQTDANGLFSVTQRSGTIEVICEATKDGYYGAGGTHEFAKFGRGDPERWKPTVNLLLRKIGQPIPMYAKRAEMKIQKESEPVGYDLMVGDWIAPHGAGKAADLFFIVRRKVVSLTEYDAELKLTFPNKGDGVTIAPKVESDGSSFRTWRTALEDGYESERTWRYSHTAGPELVPGYFIRVRTVLDENGRVKSALYGKIRGDFRFYVGTKAPRAGMGFDYYVNPTPNDRNVEFDPAKNLMRNLKPSEHVTEP